MRLILNGWRRRTVRLAVSVLLVIVMMVSGAGCAYVRESDARTTESSGGMFGPLPEAFLGESSGGEVDEPSEAEFSGLSDGKTAIPGEPIVSFDYRPVPEPSNEYSVVVPEPNLVEIRPGQKTVLHLDGQVTPVLIPEKKLPEPLDGLLNTEVEVEQAEDQAKIRITLTNISGRDLALTHGSGQRYDILVYDAQGEVVYRWSHDLAFIQMVIDWELGAGGTISFEEEWDYTNNEGHRLPSGSYVIKAVVLARLQSGEAIDPHELTADTVIEIK